MNGLLSNDFGTAVNGWQDGLLGELIRPQNQAQPQAQMPAAAMGVQVPWMFGMLPYSALPTAEAQARYPFPAQQTGLVQGQQSQPGQQSAMSQNPPQRDIWTTRNDNNPDRF
ncbi:MAG: hypothetical protein DI563_01895 [Variovorax paradoxus]|uniref:Uncharacterized protein n=1 Tax=Variovorax paradoxus TaxID=34073 RepID=A0A2W5QLV4_VARPD|nr:MAG: hypothetical protein DI563_01895 [Variovorax paradoxus]